MSKKSIFGENFGKSDSWSKMSKIQTVNITSTNVLIGVKNLFSLKIKKKSISRQKSRKVNFCQNVDKCPNSQFLVKNVVNCPRGSVLVQNIEKSILGRNVEEVNFWSKNVVKCRRSRFLVKMSEKSIYGQKCRKSQFLVKKAEQVDFWSKMP